MNVKACAAGALLAVFCAASPAAGTLQHRTDESYLISLIQSRARVCCIQFDDGHHSHYEVGVPILRSYGLVGSFGIVTGNTDVNPLAMTTAHLQEMVSYGYNFQDHTRDHNAALWGNPANASLWGADILFSQSVFAQIGIAPMRAWNQPGGTGEGFSSALRDTLKAYGYRYAAGRVGLSTPQSQNMHFGAIDDPFSWGRWAVSWTYNASPSNWTWQAVTWEYTLEGPELRPHTIHLGESLTLTDTLSVADRVDRVKFWLQSINAQPFVIDDVTAVPLASPTGVTHRTMPPWFGLRVSPNPADGVVGISFHLDTRQAVSMAVYDVRGRLVERLMAGEPVAGDVRRGWSSARLPNGIYFLRVDAAGVRESRKMVIAR